MRILLVALLGAGVGALAVVPGPTALLLALLIMVLALLLGAAKLAIDLIELIRADLVADAALLLALGFALTRITTGDRLLATALLAVALGTQALPLALARARLRDA